MTEEDRSGLLAARSDDDVAFHVKERIEERWDEDWLCETDKAWDAIHRCLSDGSLVGDGSARASLFLGGRQLHAGDGYIVNYIDGDQVRQAARQIAGLDKDWFRRRYATLAAHGYEGPRDDEDFEYSWSYFELVRELVEKAAAAGRSLVFTVDQ